MSASRVVLKPGTLSPQVLARTQHALACGALAPIETKQDLIDDSGVRFVVRRVSSLARKAQPGASTDTPEARADAGLFPFDAELLVADVSDTHVAVLNKFPVIARHLLLVTREYVDQEALLDVSDFEALAACMREYDALGFYNGGVHAGASQRHKHLQLVPLPLGAERDVPLAALFDAVRGASGVVTIPRLPFRHAFSWHEHGCASSPLHLLQTYSALLAAVGIQGVMRHAVLRQSAAYNLLLTREWMLVVPRSQECFEGISINALGFAGSIFVKSENELEKIRRARPMAALAAVAISRIEVTDDTVLRSSSD